MKLNIKQLITELQNQQNPFMLLLIGPPGVGKSTVVECLKSAGIGLHVASTDNLLEEFGKRHNLSYAEAHKAVNFKDIKRQMLAGMKTAFDRNENVVNDQTNLASKKRRTTLELAPSHYIRIGLIFDATEVELKARLSGREAQTGKKIGWGIVEEMFKSASPPSKADGFNQIWNFIGDPR